MNQFVRFFLMKLVADTLVDSSNRWIAQGRVPLSITSAVLYAVVSFTLLRKIAKDEAAGRWAIAGYVAGGAAGTWLAILASKAIGGV